MRLATNLDEHFNAFYLLFEVLRMPEFILKTLTDGRFHLGFKLINKLWAGSSKIPLQGLGNMKQNLTIRPYAKLKCSPDKLREIYRNIIFSGPNVYVS